MIRYKTYFANKYLGTIEKQSEEIKAIMTAIWSGKFPSYILLSKLENYMKYLKVSNEVMKTFYQTYIDYLRKCGKYHYRDYEVEAMINDINKKLGVNV
jgi:ketol-acid reductoisomerase